MAAPLLRPASRRRGGFTLIEALIGIAVLGIAMLGLAHAFLVGVANNRRAGDIGHAALLAQQRIDSLRTLTAAELERKLAKVLVEKQLLVNPQVQVTISDRQSKRVTVIGAVQTPGSYELAGRQTVFQILSQAGGLSRDAGREILVIRRLPDGTGTTLRIPIEDLIVKGDTQYDVPLEAGDIVNVQADQEGVIYVLGEVKAPGALKVFRSRMPSVAQAVAQAGGWTERAALGRVVVRRKDAAGNEKEIRIDLKAVLRSKAKDIPLQDGDTIYVPKGML